MTVTGQDLNARPVTRPGEILEAAPGLIVIDHADGGKANQYYLRGYNLDHGTDWRSSSTTCRSICPRMPTARAIPISTG